MNFFSEIGQDLHHSFRMFLRRPSFTVVAIITLALGIGANAAIFSVVNAVLVRPLNVRDADRLVRLAFRNPRMPLAATAATLPQFNVLRESTDTFEDLS